MRYGDLLLLFSALSLEPKALAESYGICDLPEEFVAFQRPRTTRWKAEWTPLLRKEIRANLSPFVRARDQSSWCTHRKRGEQTSESCVFTIVTGMTAYESSNNPNSRCGARGDRIPSCGLLQIQKRNCARYGYSDQDLKDPAKNFKCGLAMMEAIVRRHGVISSTPTIATSRNGHRMEKRLGLSGPWSVMISKSHPRWGHVGHLEEIYAGTTGTPYRIGHIDSANSCQQVAEIDSFLKNFEKVN